MTGLPVSEPVVRPVGDRACVIDLPSLTEVMALAEALRAQAVSGVIDIVPASTTVLVRCEDRATVRRVAAAVHEWQPNTGHVIAAGHAHDIDVVYDGADLEAVAALTGLSVNEVVAAHTGTAWSAAFGGFAPGFMYLVGGDERLLVPRLDSPRTRVPAGAVALAGPYSAVYPAESPGGWQLIGHTNTPLWHPAEAAPSLIAPGDSVRFRAVREQLRPRQVGAGGHNSVTESERVARTGGPSNAETRGTHVLTVVQPGLLALVQDAGRPGYAAIGVTESGALDRAALRRANLAVGNDPGAAAIEFLSGGCEVEAVRDTVVAVSGADARVTVHGVRECDAGEGSLAAANPEILASAALGCVCHLDGAVTLRAGERLRIAAPDRGLRSVLAVRGGVSESPTLGSRATDMLSGLGPAPLRAGDHIRVDEDGAPHAASVSSRGPGAARHRRSTPSTPASPARSTVLRYVPGPRDEWFQRASSAAFSRQTWQVTAQSNRVGVRLSGDPMMRVNDAELPSEGMVHGSIQVPPSGQPVLFLADHPVTGGYPVIGTVIDDDLDAAAQLRPGDEVRFFPVNADQIGSPITQAHAEPDRVTVAIEVDGQRHAVLIPRPIAAALDQAAAAGNRTELEQFMAVVAEHLVDGRGR